MEDSEAEMFIDSSDESCLTSPDDATLYVPGMNVIDEDIPKSRIANRSNTSNLQPLNLIHFASFVEPSTVQEGLEHKYMDEKMTYLQGVTFKSKLKGFFLFKDKEEGDNISDTILDWYLRDEVKSTQLSMTKLTHMLRKYFNTTSDWG